MIQGATLITSVVTFAAVAMAFFFAMGLLFGCTGPQMVRAVWRTLAYFCGPAWSAQPVGQGRPTRSVSMQAPCTYLWKWEDNEKSRRFYAEGQGFKNGGKVWLRNRQLLPPPRREFITARPYVCVVDHDADSGEE